MEKQLKGTRILIESKENSSISGVSYKPEIVKAVNCKLPSISNKSIFRNEKIVKRKTGKFSHHRTKVNSQGNNLISHR